MYILNEVLKCNLRNMIYRRDNLAGASRLELPTIDAFIESGDRCSTN
jgi:hypothetical protein